MSNLKSKINLSKLSPKAIIGFVVVLVLGLIAGGGISLSIAPNEDGSTDITIEANYNIELADEQVPTIVEAEEGEIEVIEAPTVEEIDGGQITECPEGEDCGRGAYVYVDITSPQTIRESIEGNCVDVDGAYGSQCFDTTAAVSENMTGRRLTTCGTGAASGMMNCWEQNAGSDYEVIWDPTKLQPGDSLVSGGGRYGHTGVVLGYYNNGYIALLSTNQGGKACDGGGSTANVVNFSLKNFLGAYRWKGYIKEEPAEPELPLPISNCVQWHVERGDTMGKIMLECENTVRYGEAMNAYAKTWYSLVFKPGQSVYDGWHSKSGVGLYAGDDIEHRLE